MINKRGREYWSARELMFTLEYSDWENFLKVITEAKKSSKMAANNPNDHFLEIEKMVKIGFGANRKISDFLLSKYAWFLIAQNSDASKKSVADAQAYFAVQTHRQEIFEQLSPEKRRLLIREEVIDHNKKLNQVAKQTGVKNFGSFHDSGYQGLYGMRYRNLIKYKKLGKDKLLDRAGETELAANLFRITQAQDLISKKISNKTELNEPKVNVLHFIVGKKVRKAIKEIGGTMPENLQAEKHIKEIQENHEQHYKLNRSERAILNEYNSGEYISTHSNIKKFTRIAKNTINRPRVTKLHP